MIDTVYDVQIDGVTIAKDMDLHYAIMLIKGIYNEYWEEAEKGLTVTIKSHELKGNANTEPLP